MRAWIRAAFAAIVLAAAAPAAASEPAPSAPVPERAAELKKAGDDAMESLRYADALAAYTEAYDLSHAPALLYNKGRALQALDRFPEALAQLEAFATVAPADLRARVPGLGALIAEVRARVSTLRLECSVAGARVLVRNVAVGTTPLAPLKLTAGRADVEVVADGRFPFRRSVDLPGGGELVLAADLPSRSTTGLLVVRAPAAGADVAVDGRGVGHAPAEVLVPAGTHRVLVRHPDHADASASVVVVAGERKEVTVALAPPSIASRWWFWAGLGAAAVAGGVLGYALLTERKADRGDIPPGQIAAPLVRF